MEPLDNWLNELGRGLPFDVDWPEYHREVLRRLARADARRTHRAWLLALGSALAGAAASLLFMLAMRPAVPAPRNSPVARAEAPAPESDAKPLSYVKVIRNAASGTGVIRGTIDPPRAAPNDTRAEIAKPFTKRNGASEIRFDGFSESDSSTAGFIVAGPAHR